MRKTRRTYSACRLFSAVMMIAALAWLTVSLPVVYRAQQALAEKTQNAANASGRTDNSGNLLAGTTEEKTPPAVNEEYLHHDEEQVHPYTEVPRQYKEHRASVYVAFHGELLSPPPES